MHNDNLKPNDVAMVLRPNLDEEGDWDGSFVILNSVYGPVTMKQDDLESLMGLCVLVSSVIQYMDDDPEIAEKVMENFSQNYGHTQQDMVATVNRMYEGDVVDELTTDSFTVGGVQ